MLQVSNVPATLTVAEHLQLFASYYPRPLPLCDVVELACLQSLARRRFEALSGGERQRLFFALAELKARATDGYGAATTLERAYLSLMKAVA